MRSCWPGSSRWAGMRSRYRAWGSWGLLGAGPGASAGGRLRRDLWGDRGEASLGGLWGWEHQPREPNHPQPLWGAPSGVGGEVVLGATSDLQDALATLAFLGSWYVKENGEMPRGHCRKHRDRLKVIWGKLFTPVFTMVGWVMLTGRASQLWSGELGGECLVWGAV